MIWGFLCKVQIKSDCCSFVESQAENVCGGILLIDFLLSFLWFFNDSFMDLLLVNPWREKKKFYT